MSEEKKCVKVLVMDERMSFFDSFSFTPFDYNTEYAVPVAEQSFQLYLQRRQTGACHYLDFACSFLQIDGVIHKKTESNGMREWQRVEWFGR